MKTLNENAYAYIIKSINPENYDVVARGTAKKLQFLHDTFVKEAGWNIERVGEVNAFKEWAQGLPSAFNIEFTNYEILQLAKKWGQVTLGDTQREDHILNNYWNFIAVKTFQLFKKYKIV